MKKRREIVKILVIILIVITAGSLGIRSLISTNHEDLI